MNLSTLKSSVAGREWPVVLAFILPAVFVLVFLRLVPGIQGLIHSFQVKGSFVGFSNYRYLFTHENALNSIQVTLWFNLVINPFQILVAFMIALLLEQKLPGTDIFRIIIFVPIAVPLAVSSIIWGVAFRPDDGLINALLQLMRIPPQQWLTSTKQAGPLLDNDSGFLGGRRVLDDFFGCRSEEHTGILLRVSGDRRRKLPPGTLSDNRSLDETAACLCSCGRYRLQFSALSSDSNINAGRTGKFDKPFYERNIYECV